ncbi:MAG: tol-pal system protein YbgF [Deltaproteobacteria bacterium]|nr:MAG: tol-pal system protein YbgF [Deltaproteobacteria bacterium]
MFRVGLPFFLIVSMLLSGCVVTEQDLQMQRDLLEMKRRLGETERALKELQDDASGGVRAHVETLARNQADFQAELDGVRVDLQSIQGQTGDQERVNEDMRQDLTLLRDELSLQIVDHEQRLSLLEGGGGVDLQKPVTKSSPTILTQPTVKPQAVTPGGESAPELYERALKTIREQRDFVAGREMMETFLKRYPKDDLAVNAAYWIGETFYAEKAYEQSILQFEEVIETYGEHPKVASAMLKQALAFEASGDKATAELLLQKLIKRYPLSGEAEKAKKKLQTP